MADMNSSWSYQLFCYLQDSVAGVTCDNSEHQDLKRGYKCKMSFISGFGTLFSNCFYLLHCWLS